MNKSKDFLGRGFAFPPRIDSATGQFVMTESEEDIRQSIYIILMTRMKERAMLPDFGCNLHEYIFEVPDSEFEVEIGNEIVEALTKYEPRIINVEVRVDTKNLTDTQVYKRANMDRRLFSKIRSNKEYSPKKTTVFSLAIALKLSVAETEKLLASAGYAFNMSSKADVIIRYFLEREEYDIFTINETLFCFEQNVLN